MVMDRILEALGQFPNLWGQLDREITADRALRYLEALETVHGPSQTVRWTRALVVERLLAADGLLGAPGVTWVRNYESSGNATLLLGSAARAKRVWLLAHLDQISYLVEPGVGPLYDLMPLCYHMQRVGGRPGVALAFDLATRQLVVTARGEIQVRDGRVRFALAEGGPIGPGHRVVYDSQLNHDAASGRITGYLDDSVGCVALLLAAAVLRAYPVEVFIGLTDEEEGPPSDGSQAFARGGRRLLRYFDAPELVIVSDSHEGRAMERGGGPEGLVPGDGAVFVERSSAGRGAPTPPHLYALQQQLAAALATRGIRLRENRGGYVARSEDVNAAALTPNIALLGFLAHDRHYAADVPTAHLADVLDLARAVACFALLAHTTLWDELLGARDD